MAVQKQDDQHEHTFSSYVRIRDVVLNTYLGWWTIGRSGERGSGISVLPARYDDDDCSRLKFYFVLMICLPTVKRSQVLLCIANNSIKHQSFIYTRSNDLIVQFLTIQFSVITLFKLGLPNTSTASPQRSKTPPSPTSVLDMTQQFDGEAPVILELWGIRSTSLLRSGVSSWCNG